MATACGRCGARNIDRYQHVCHTDARDAEIAHLHAEVARLTRDKDAVERQWRTDQEHSDMYAEERDALRSCVTQLAEALRWLLAAIERPAGCVLCAGGPEPDSPVLDGHHTLCAGARARAALAAAEKLGA